MVIGASVHPAQAAKGGGGGGKNKPGESEVGQIIPVQLIFDEQHHVTGENNRLVSDYMRNDPNDPASYFHGEDGGLIDVGENFSIYLDPNDTGNTDPPRSFTFPEGISVEAGLSCSELPSACLPDLGTTRIKGTDQPAWQCGDGSEPVLPVGDPILRGRAKDAFLFINGDNHDDTPVGCARHVNARIILLDSNDKEWRIHFGGRIDRGGFLGSPCGSCIVAERLPNTSDGRGVWRFYTESPHWGYLYSESDNRKIRNFYGIVSLPFSGIVVSLAPEPEPTALACEDFEDATSCPNP